MALGGGVFLTQNKVLPGTYINFVSVVNASANLSDRGTVIFPIRLSWGAEASVIELSSAEFIKNSLKRLGYAYTDDALKPLREVFLHASKILVYNLNSGGTKAANATIGDAKYAGAGGNNLKAVVTANDTTFDVVVSFGAVEVEKYEAIDDLVGLTSDYIDFDEDAELAAGTYAFTGGADGTYTETSAYTAFMLAADSYTFNAMAIPTDTAGVIAQAVAYVKNARDNQGKKFQIVVYNTGADYEGVVNVKNNLNLVPWVTGVVGGTAVNKSATNLIYDGEYTVNTNYSQEDLEGFIKAGYFALHAVNGKVKVLRDINSFVTTTAEKSADFGNNQVIRVLDQIANDIAVLFADKYLGKIQNNDSGRVSLWGDIVKHHEELQRLGAVEGFTSEDVIVEAGVTREAVAVTDNITPVAAMEKLYMTVYVS